MHHVPHVLDWALMGHRQHRSERPVWRETGGELMTEHTTARPLVVGVEDEPGGLTTLVRQIQRVLPHVTILAGGDGADVLAQVAERDVLLAVVDYYLRGRSGLTLVAALKVHSPQLRTILITASPTPEVEQAVQAAGVDLLLPK